MCLPKIQCLVWILGQNKVSDFDSRAKSLLKTVFIFKFKGPKNGYFQQKLKFDFLFDHCTFSILNICEKVKWTWSLFLTTKEGKLRNE